MSLDAPTTLEAALAALARAPLGPAWPRMALEALVDDEAALIERVVDAAIDLDAYRLLAKETIHRLATVTRERDQARATIARLLDERRGRS